MIDLAGRNAAIQSATPEAFTALRPAFCERMGGEPALVRADNTYYLRNPDGTAARFNLCVFPNCGAACVLCDLWVAKQLRRKGVGGLLLQLQTQVARRCRMHLLLCTVRQRNAAMLHLLEQAGWAAAGSCFTNPETGNTLRLMCRTLEGEPIA